MEPDQLTNKGTVDFSQVRNQIAADQRIAELETALATATRQNEELTKIHVTSWNALRRAAATFRWLDADSHSECSLDVATVADALKLTPTESGGYVVILGTELDSLRQQLTAALSLVEQMKGDKELADLVRASFALSLTDFPPEAEIKWLFELPMRNEQGNRFKQLATLPADQRKQEGETK